MLWPGLTAALAIFAASDAALAQMSHKHDQAQETCSDLTLACAGTVTPGVRAGRHSMGRRPRQQPNLRGEIT